jgi:single-stranded-DNA-specific exonuclease
VRPSVNSAISNQQSTLILDWRKIPKQEYRKQETALIIEDCPTNWDDLRAWFRKSLYNHQQLALAWSKPQTPPPSQVWLTLVGLAKYLNRTNEKVTRVQLLEKLGIGDQTLHLGFKALKYLGFTIQRQDRYLQITWNSDNASETLADAAVNQFIAAVREEQFQQKYFAEVPLNTILAIATQTARSPLD